MCNAICWRREEQSQSHRNPRTQETSNEVGRILEDSHVGRGMSNCDNVQSHLPYLVKETIKAPISWLETILQPVHSIQPNAIIALDHDQAILSQRSRAL